MKVIFTFLWLFASSISYVQHVILADWTWGKVDFFLIDEAVTIYDEKDLSCKSNFQEGNMGVLRKKERVDALAAINSLFTFQREQTLSEWKAMDLGISSYS